MSLYFNASQLPAPTLEYAAWLDIMAIGPAMSRSIDIAANFIFKFHLAAIMSLQAAGSVHLYPVMDGIYAVSANQSDMLDFLREIFGKIAEEFIATGQSEPAHRFIIRSALAFGPMIRGENIPNSATQPPGGQSNPFIAQQNYRNSILLGMPMVQAHLSETFAPPFGIYIHESARAFAPRNSKPLHFSWWKWGNSENANWANLPAALSQYYQWCKEKSRSIDYKNDRIAEHESMIQEYFR